MERSDSTNATEADIVERLRSEQTPIGDCEYMNRLTHEAADEIEQLRKREAYLVAELNACTHIPSGDKDGLE